jgi:hypothetical protein
MEQLVRSLYPPRISFWRDGFHVSEVHQQYLNLGEVA